MDALAVIGIVVSLVLLILMAYKGWSVIAIAPLVALVAVIISAIAYGNAPYLLAHYTETFMGAAGTFVKNYFPIFMLGALFGKMLELSGCAQTIANTITEKLGGKAAILALIITGAVLTYGGVSAFVAVFAMYPIGAKLFRAENIPKRLLPGTIVESIFTFSMTCLPGTSQVQNAIPMRFLGTDAFAAPVLGIIAAALEFGFGYWWLTGRAKKAKAAGEGYGDYKENFREEAEIPGGLPSFGLSVIPIILVIVVNLILSKFYFTNTNTEYLDAFNTTLSSVIGSWSLLIALIIGVLFVIITNLKRLGGIPKAIYDGISGAFLPIFNTASETGYGTVISSLPAYSLISGAIVNVSGNVLLSTAIASTVLAGITGSATGGLTIALATMGDKLVQLAHTQGVSVAAMHRIAVVACGGLDSLPHNGAVITVLAVCGLTHKQSYKDMGMCTVVFPLITTAVIILLASLGLQF